MTNNNNNKDKEDTVPLEVYAEIYVRLERMAARKGITIDELVNAILASELALSRNKSRNNSQEK